MILDETRDEPAAVVMPQHPLVVAARDDQHLAAPGSLERHGAGSLPFAGIEPRRHRRFTERGSGQHRVPAVAHDLRVSHRRGLALRARAPA